MFELIGIQIKHSYKKTNREKINEMSDKKFILFLEEIYSEGKRNHNFEYDLEWCKKKRGVSMERLTYYRDSDKAVCPKFLASQFSPEFFAEFVQKVFEKLARYEDLGYEPEELRRFLNHDGEDDWEDIK